MIKNYYGEKYAFEYCFLLRIQELKNNFGQNFGAIDQIFGQKFTSEIPKFENILCKNFKNRFFFQMWVEAGQNVRKYYNFSRRIGPCKSSRTISALINYAPENKNLKMLRIFHLWVNTRQKIKTIRFFFNFCLKFISFNNRWCNLITFQKQKNIVSLWKDKFLNQFCLLKHFENCQRKAVEIFGF